MSETNAAVIVIGNEILSGRTRDANLGFIAEKLAQIGIPVAEARVVPDVEARIAETVNELRRRYAYVLTTGGIGPTHDDVTARAVARAFGVGFGRNAEAERRLRGYYEPAMINADRLSMADMPDGVELIDNPVSVAPGFRLENVIVLPGVPKIMQAMIDGLLATLRGGPPVSSAAVTVFAAEGEVAGLLRAVQSDHPRVELGSYPFFRQGRIGTTIIGRGTDADAVAYCVRALIRAFDDRGLEHASFDAAATPAP